MPDTSSKAHVIICAHPTLGHVLPLRLVAKDLVARGYQTTFTTDPSFEKHVAPTGAKFVPLLGLPSLDDPEMRAKLLSKPAGFGASQASLDRIAFAFEHAFASTIPAQHKMLQTLMAESVAQSPETPVVIIHDIGVGGLLPMMNGAPGLRPSGVMTLGVCPLFVSSCDVAPFGLGLAPDSSPEGKQRNAVLTRMGHLMHNAPNATVNKTIESLGASACPMFFLDAVVRQPDRFLQLCIPELEYPRSDAPINLRFTGGLPRGRGEPWTDRPPWWAEVEAAKAAGKRIVGVSQGTLLIDYEDLIVPTLDSLAHEDDIVTVAALGLHGAKLPDDCPAPANAFVGDYIPFDELLALCDVFVTNGGYGGFQHAISHGVPLVVAGVGADKPEVAARAVWAGVGLDLKTDTPSEKEVRAAVLRCLNEDTFRAKAKELAAKIEEWNCFDVIAKNVDELAAEGPKVKEFDGPKVTHNTAAAKEDEEEAVAAQPKEAVNGSVQEAAAGITEKASAAPKSAEESTVAATTAAVAALVV